MDVSIEPAKCIKAYRRIGGCIYNKRYSRVMGEYRTGRDLCAGGHAIEPGSRCENVVQNRDSQ